MRESVEYKNTFDGQGYRSVFEESAANLLAACTDSYQAAIAAAVDTIVDAFQSGRKFLVFGNGGSCADAQHVCAELVGRFAINRPGLPAIALSSDQAVLTAWSNDFHFDTLFQRQIETLGKPGDVACGISTSGNSTNVVYGLQAARKAGLKTIGLTGRDGGKVAPWCDVLIAGPSSDTPRVQEIHMVTYHAICGAIEARMFGTAPLDPG